MVIVRRMGVAVLDASRRPSGRDDLHDHPAPAVPAIPRRLEAKLLDAWRM
jgi:hypothetical protein